MTKTDCNIIIDSTLREGEQTPGVHFSDSEKLELVQVLAATGIKEIEIGVASSRSPGLPTLVTSAKQAANGHSQIALWCRCSDKDIEFAALCQPDILSLSLPVSDIHLREKLHKNRNEALDLLQKSIANALYLGLPAVSVGFEDATRANPDFLIQAARAAHRAGAFRIRLADTVGIASPEEVSTLVKQIGAAVPIPLGFHGHNDFGMATANALSALAAGAKWIDATVLGLGERAGNCRLEEAVAYLELRKNIGRYRVRKLPNLCKLVAAAAGVEISSRHPVVGEAIFTCETGLHVQGLTSNPKTYEPYPPARIGRCHTLQFGSKTGRRAVENRLADLGMILGKDIVEDLVTEIRQQALLSAVPLDDEGLLELAGRKLTQNQVA